MVSAFVISSLDIPLEGCGLAFGLVISSLDVPLEGCGLAFGLVISSLDVLFKTLDSEDLWSFIVGSGGGVSGTGSACLSDVRSGAL